MQLISEFIENSSSYHFHLQISHFYKMHSVEHREAHCKIQ